MSECVILNTDGTLTFTGQPVAECAGYVLVSGSEYGVLTALDSALQMPSPEIAAGWVIGPMTLIVGFYQAGYLVGQVAKFFNRD